MPVSLDTASSAVTLLLARIEFLRFVPMHLVVVVLILIIVSSFQSTLASSLAGDNLSTCTMAKKMRKSLLM